MKLIRYIPVLLLSLLLFYSTSAQANTLFADPVDFHEAETVIVTATRVETNADHTAENSIIYTEEEIKKIPARDLGEVLTHIPGVDVQVVNKLGQPTSLSIQGSQSRQVLVMIDDIPFNTQLSGQMNPTLIPVGNIKRIEVIKGAASSAWGSSLGGVINVITKDVGDTDQLKGVVTSSYAEFNTLKNSLELSGKVAYLGYLLYGSHFTTDGIREGAGVEENKIFAKFSHPIGDEATITAQFGYTGTEKVNDFYEDPVFLTTELQQPNYARYGKVSFDVEKSRSSFSTAFKYNDQHIKSYQNLVDFAFATTTVSQNTYYGVSIRGSQQFRDDDVFVYGSDISQEVFESNMFVTEAKSISVAAPYVNYTLRTDWLDIIPGLRYDINEEFGSEWSPSMGIVLYVDDFTDTRVRLKASRAFNAPPLLWIFNESATVAPNPSLRAETGVVYEAGISTEFIPKLSMDLNAYVSEIQDAIATVTIAGGKSQKQNFDRFRRRGGELSMKYQMFEDLMIFGGGAFNDVEDKVLNQTVRDQGISRQNFHAGFQYQSESGLSVYVKGYYDRRHITTLAQPNDRKFIVDAKLSKEFRDIKEGVDLTTFLNIHNITNSKYWSSITFPIPERYFEGGLSVKF